MDHYSIFIIQYSIASTRLDLMNVLISLHQRSMEMYEYVPYLCLSYHHTPSIDPADAKAPTVTRHLASSVIISCTTPSETRLDARARANRNSPPNLTTVSARRVRERHRARTLATFIRAPNHTCTYTGFDPFPFHYAFPIDSPHSSPIASFP